MGRFLDIMVADEQIRLPGVFHLTDPDGDKDIAYSFGEDESVEDIPLAEVHSQISLRFTPIDHNSEFEALEQTRNRRCDGYLRSEDADTLIFVELKNRAVENPSSTKAWVRKSIDQLRQTVVLFRREEPEKSRLSEGGIHRAYVCNPKGPYHVPESVRSTKKMFLTATRNFLLCCDYRIDVGNDAPEIQ